MLLGLMALWTQAAPALRGAFTVTQADGTRLTIEQFGDEYHHWTSTTDGIMVVNTGKGYYVAHIKDDGQVEATNLLAHEPAFRSGSEQAAAEVQRQRMALFHEKGEQARRRALSVNSNRYPYLPHLGQPHVLCILAEFQDVGFTVNRPVEAFYQLMNGDTQADLGNENSMNYCSVSQYFQACSHGLFAPVFDVVGPVVLPHELAYYGGKSSTGGDDEFTKFCADAMEQVKAEGMVTDWSLYDNDGDGRIELVTIIYAGYGQNQGGSEGTLWAKASQVNLRVDDDYKASFFNCSCELFHPDERYKSWINGTGVFCHEMSHCMGLPDLYATSSSGYVNNQGMESWDIMDYGCYNKNGFAPALYTAWEQEVMGWTSIEVVTDGQELPDILPIEEGGKAYKIVNSDDERDYIVMENIQQRGVNSAARGHGLLVYHVAYPYSSVNMFDHPNNTPGRPGVAVVPAGGLLINNYLRGTDKTYTTEQWRQSIAASAFPGSQGVSRLSDQQQLPNYHFNTADGGTKPVSFTLDNIAEDAATGAVSVSLTATGIKPLPLDNAPWSGKAYTLSGWQQAAPRKGIVIYKGKKGVKPEN